ncbi:hypothetical protein QBZ16_003366 [Prototheca wickerhamii]|uniref:PTC1-like winged helix-turn-helix domain-containing protein n=1 Tax=Prototheca wickerhamii TaxID=3111 RepID=A0AAD9MND3_PROWI|nr:hypothetical protein QBZ16_003366 [Prototheca wickerhamii]
MPEEYDFLPPTYLLPEEAPAFLARLGRAADQEGGQAPAETWLLKPDPGSQGRGITLAQSRADVIRWVEAQHEAGARPAGVASRHVDRPMLLLGRKFDLRVYVLVVGGAGLPLQARIFSEGLVRRSGRAFAPPGPANLDDVALHLTNWAVQREALRRAARPEPPPDAEDPRWHKLKWDFATLRAQFAEEGRDWQPIWQGIRRLVARTLLAVAPLVQAACPAQLPGQAPAASCFELLGYDVLLDDQARPWLLEVNASPSLCLDTAVDKSIKPQLIRQTLSLVNPKAGRGQGGWGVDAHGAQHAEILRLCTASFLKDTAQGRLHSSLDRIRMRRVEADEERAAKALRDSQRAASLKRWIMRKHVLLRPAEDGLEPFVAQVVGHSSDDGVRQLKVRWYYREIRSLPADIVGSSAVPARPGAGDPAHHEDGSRKKRRKTAAPEASSDGLPRLSSQNQGLAVAHHVAVAAQEPVVLVARDGRPGATPASPLGAARAGFSLTPSPAGSDPGAQTEDSAAQRCVPASVLSHSRWSARRYEAGRAALVRILREMGALSGMTAVLRPVLRETARKAIGDTGLLDHLLKHMADQVVSAEGDFLRRRHNKEGHMVYWLQSPSQAELAGELLKNEVSALSSELQELKEARPGLERGQGRGPPRGPGGRGGGARPPARAEDTPGQAASPFTRPAPGAEALAARVESVAADMAAVNSSVLAGLEEVRSESAGLARLTGEHLRKVVAGVEGLARRHAGLESHVLQLEDAGGGRLEALVSAAREIGDVRERMAGLESRMQMVELVVLSLKNNMEGTLAASCLARGTSQDPMLTGASYGSAKRDTNLDRLHQHAA